MADPYLVELVRKALEDQRKIPPRERFEAMVRRGAIDSQGRVLLRYPKPPYGVEADWRNLEECRRAGADKAAGETDPVHPLGQPTVP